MELGDTYEEEEADFESEEEEVESDTDIKKSEAVSSEDEPIDPPQASHEEVRLRIQATLIVPIAGIGERTRSSCAKKDRHSSRCRG